MGDGINTWSDFLAQPEIGMTVREANQLIQLAEYVSGVNVPLWELNLATARFAALRGIVDPELLDDMKVLTLKDFKDRHYDKNTDDKGERTYKYLVMKRCNETGNLSKVYTDEVEKIEKRLAEELGDKYG